MLINWKKIIKLIKQIEINSGIYFLIQYEWETQNSLIWISYEIFNFSKVIINWKYYFYKFNIFLNENWDYVSKKVNRKKIRTFKNFINQIWKYYLFCDNSDKLLLVDDDFNKASRFSINWNKVWIKIIYSLNREDYYIILTWNWWKILKTKNWEKIEIIDFNEDWTLKLVVKWKIDQIVNEQDIQWN